MNMISNNKYMTSPGRMSLPVTDNNDLSHDDDLSGKLNFNIFNILNSFYD